MNKLKRVDKWCPNVFYDTDIYALGEIKTWDEYEKHPLAKKWKLDKDAFEEATGKFHYHDIILFQKQCNNAEKVVLIITYSNGEPHTAYDMNGEYITNQYMFTQFRPYFSRIKDYIYTERQKRRHCKNEDTNTIEKDPDLSKEAYDLSSELFSFKDMRRGVIEHGKTCYIEGYKKHAELFYNFLLKNGYFSEEELERMRKEFNAFQTQGPELNLETAEKYLKMCDICKIRDGKWCKIHNPDLNDIQKDIFNCYTQLTNSINTLRIQKPRIKGVSTILKFIARIEALNGKQVLYAGYGETKYLRLKNVKNITFKQINSLNGNFSPRELRGKSYDLIIVDEIVSFENPWELFFNLNNALSENGRIILVGTPGTLNYEIMKKFFSTTYPNILSYKPENINLTESDTERLNTYPECRNEILGEFLD